VDAPYTGRLSRGSHQQRVIALAGALAEAGVIRLEVEVPGGEVLQLEARATDLPGFLANRFPVLHASGRTVLSVTPAAIAWETLDPRIHEAMVRAGASLR
jgi:hypothetical protein